MNILDYMKIIRRVTGQTLKHVLAKPNEVRKAMSDVTELLKKHNEDIAKSLTKAIHGRPESDR